MNRTISFIIFITLVSLVYFGLHFVVFKILTRALDVSGSARKFIKIFFWFSGLSFPMAMLLSRQFKVYFLNYYAYVWLGIIAIAFFVMVITGVVVKFVPAHARLIAFIALGITGIIVLVSLVNGLREPVVKNITIPIKKLPAHLSGFSIVHLSDVHLEAYKSKNAVGHMVDVVNDLKPDLVAITGDLIDSNICEEVTFCEHLKRLKGTYGTVAITGNHEFYAGIAIFNELAKRSEFKVLRNESVTVANGLQIVGLDDREARNFGLKGPDLDTALKGNDPTKPTILLYHRPDYFDEAIKKGVDLQLSGHTHGGQIPPMDLLVQLFYKYPAGLYEKDGSYIYTSFGTGYWGPPMRFLSRNEIVKITLISN
ncbi:MAG: metallophosphoesterase [bacterium]|nr:metallophosphoesterase [bacterium]